MGAIRKGTRVCVKKTIDSYLDPGRYRGLCGTVVKKDEKYEDQYWVKIDSRRISKTCGKVPGITTIWHIDDLIIKRRGR